MAAMFALLATFAIQRIPGAERITVEPPEVPSERFDAAWADAFQTAVLRKTDPLQVRKIDMTAATLEQPKPVVTERIMPDAPAKVPPVLVVQEADEQPAARRRHHRIRTASVESNVCTRHGMHKQVTRGGKSWRCKR